MRDQFHIWGFTAAGAGAAELEQRAKQLRILDRGRVDQFAIEIRDLHEEVPVFGFGFTERWLGFHVDSPAPDLGLVLHRAYFHTERTTRAVFWCDLDSIRIARREFLELRRHMLERFRCIRQQLLIIYFMTDDSMRTNHHTFSALDAQAFIPHRDFESDISLLPLRCPCGESSVDRKCRDRDVITIGADDLAQHVADKFRRFTRDWQPARRRRCDRCRDCDLIQILERSVHGVEVFPDHGLPALAIGLFDGVFDLSNGRFARENAADGKESRLHDRIHTTAHAGLFGNFIAVDHIEFQFLFDDVLLHFDRQVIPDFLGSVQAVEQEDGALFCILEHIHALEERELMTGNEIGLIELDEIRRADGLRPETQV